MNFDFSALLISSYLCIVHICTWFSMLDMKDGITEAWGKDKHLLNYPQILLKLICSYLVKNFLSKFIFFFFFFFVISLWDFGIWVILASQKMSGSIAFSCILLKSLHKIDILYPLNIWYNISLKPPRRKVFI